LTLYYIAIAIIGILAFIGYKIYSKRHKAKDDKSDNKDGGKKELNLYKPIYARVLDNVKRAVYYETIPAGDVGVIIANYHNLGRQWKRDGKDIYGMIKVGEHDYKPIPVKSRSNNPPEKLHFDMEQPEIPIIMDMREEKNFLQKYGMVLVWGGIMAFIMFLVIASRSTH